LAARDSRPARHVYLGGLRARARSEDRGGVHLVRRLYRLGWLVGGDVRDVRDVRDGGDVRLGDGSRGRACSTLVGLR
jgi:hypothetical protein